MMPNGHSTFLDPLAGRSRTPSTSRPSTHRVSAAEHGMNASTFTARVIASTGADVAAALSGRSGRFERPLHGGGSGRVLPMLEEVDRTGDARGLVKGILDRGES